MKTNEIDKLISDVLSKEEAEFYNELQEESLPEMLGGLFVGKMKILNTMMLIGMFIVFGLAIFCLIQFLNANAVLESVKWAAGFGFFMMATGFIKIVQFMQINNNTLLREIKKLELQQAVLVSKLKK